MVFQKFPHFSQLDITDCGPTCLQIVAQYYGRRLDLESIRALSRKTRTGTTLLGLSEAAEKLGFRTLGLKITYQELAAEIPKPCIVFWKHKHFVVIYKIKKNKIYISDPALGLLKLTYEEFLKGWTGSSSISEGIVLALEPTTRFYEGEEIENYTAKGADNPLSSFKMVFSYLGKYRKLLLQIFVGLLAGSLLQLAMPFLTQAIIDVGIAQHDLSFIYLILIAQLLIFVGATSIELFRSVILMHISSRINVHLLSDFFLKLFRLPIGFFDTKMAGDLLQRIRDHLRLETFLTSGTLNILFSFINLVVFGIVLAIYDAGVFYIFLGGSVLFFVWILSFMKKRAEYDYRRFNQMSENSDMSLELIYGMQEIKLNNSELRKRWQWEYLQTKLFKINLLGLRIENWQSGGSSLINELKNILITFYTAKLVLEGDITLGMMLSIAFIIGQLNVPLSQLAGFARLYHDAKLSMDRINDTYRKEEEEKGDSIQQLPEKQDIRIENLSFRYQGMRKGQNVIQNLNLCIPQNKMTAIVGASGSGKTTLMKLLLKFYEPQEGTIRLGPINLADLSHQSWRSSVGVVMQDGFIFADTIGENIAVTDERVDTQKLEKAAKMANIHGYISELPLGYQTKIGANGANLSAGQRQRILIARAIYKNPEFLFFDEATSALDAENERIITENLDRFFSGRTAVVIAHRLSTVRNADHIVVLNKGTIAESGTHEELVAQRGYYYNLIKNQLELGS